MKLLAVVMGYFGTFHVRSRAGLPENGLSPGHTSANIGRAASLPHSCVAPQLTQSHPISPLSPISPILPPSAFRDYTLCLASSDNRKPPPRTFHPRNAGQAGEKQPEARAGMPSFVVSASDLTQPLTRRSMAAYGRRGDGAEEAASLAAPLRCERTQDHHEQPAAAALTRHTQGLDGDRRHQRRHRQPLSRTTEPAERSPSTLPEFSECRGTFVTALRHAALLPIRLPSPSPDLRRRG